MPVYTVGRGYPRWGNVRRTRGGAVSGEECSRRDEWHKKAEKWHAYHEKQLAKAEKSGIIKVHSFHTDSDPMFEVTGSAFESNPEEIQDIIRQLTDWGGES